MVLKKRMAMIAATMMVMTLLTGTALAGKLQFPTWSINPGGIRVTSSTEKTDSVTAAVVGLIRQSCSAGSYTVNYKALDTNNAVVTSPRDYSVMMPSFSLPYLSGKGVMGKEYKLRIQNSSGSAGAVTVAGSFTP